MNAPAPIKGFGKLGKFCNAILAYAKSSDIQSILVEKLPVGSTTPPSAEITNPLTGKLVRLKVPSGAGIANFPWEVTTSGSSPVVASIRPGTVNSLLPSNIFNTFNLSAGTNYIKIQCDTDGQTVNAVTLSVSGSAPTGLIAAENVAPSTFYDVIAVVVVSGTPASAEIFQVRYTNLTANPIIDFVATRAAPSPLEEPFVRWFKWAITG